MCLRRLLASYPEEVSPSDSCFSGKYEGHCPSQMATRGHCEFVLLHFATVFLFASRGASPASPSHTSSSHEQGQFPQRLEPRFLGLASPFLRITSTDARGAEGRQPGGPGRLSAPNPGWQCPYRAGIPDVSKVTNVRSVRTVPRACCELRPIEIWHTTLKQQ